MTTLEIWLLAISLAMDCFTVSITSGIIMRRICWRTFFIMAFFFGLFQAVMPLIGWFAASRFSHLIEDYDHWIAFGLLAFLGGRMIKESFSNEDKCCFDPTTLKVIVTLAIATSIDALAIGISFAFVGMNRCRRSCASACPARPRPSRGTARTCTVRSPWRQHWSAGWTGTSRGTGRRPPYTYRPGSAARGALPERQHGWSRSRTRRP